VGGPLAGALRSEPTLGFVGGGERVLAALEAGAVGAILAVVNAAPEPCTALFGAWRDHDLDRARALQARIAELVQALRPWGVAGVKAAMAARGWDGGEARSPLVMPDPAAQAAIAAALARALREP
jgi:dihydrodipicolinate synthase/N-acetylneuraminate lyase